MNVSGSDVGKLRFVAIQVPFLSNFLSIYPLNVDGHWGQVAIDVLRNFNWNYEGQLADSENVYDYGKIYGEGNGTGMLGVLARNESDVGLSPTEMSPGDFRYLDYSPILWDRRLYILSSEASTARYHSSDFAFLDIYSPWVWLAWGTSLFLLTVFWVFAKILLSTYPDNRHRLSSRNDAIGDFLNAFKISLNQGVELPPSKDVHLRLVALCWIVGCLIINVGFTGGLLTKLTLPPKPIYIENMKDILKYPHLLIQITKESDIERILQSSTNGVLRQIHDRVVRFDSALDFSDVDLEGTFDKLIRGETVTFIWEDGLKAILPMIFDCDVLKGIHISEVGSFISQSALLLRKDLDPRKAKLFKRTIQYLFEATISTHALMFDYWKYGKCFLEDPVPLKPLDMSAIKVTSYGLLLGYLCSAIAFIIEMKYPPRMESRRKRVKMFRNSVHV